MVVRVDPGHKCSRIQDLQQRVVSVIISLCNVHMHNTSFDKLQEATVQNSRLPAKWASLVSVDLLARSDCTGYRE